MINTAPADWRVTAHVTESRPPHLISFHLTKLLLARPRQSTHSTVYHQHKEWNYAVRSPRITSQVDNCPPTWLPLVGIHCNFTKLFRIIRNTFPLTAICSSPYRGSDQVCCANMARRL
jgi:hypothetical protein